MQKPLLGQKKTMKENKKKMEELKKKGLSYQKIGKQFNISKARVYQIISGYRSIDWNKHYNLYLKIKRRDRYKCRVCDCENSEFIIHHADKNTKNNAELNLMTVCKKCHLRIHNTQNSTNKYKL